MIIAIDYDDTFTRDPDAWLEAMNVMRRAGHSIYGVTMRYPNETGNMSNRYLAACDRIYFTGRKGKKAFLDALGITIDVWIDDSPLWVLKDAVA